MQAGISPLMDQISLPCMNEHILLLAVYNMIINVLAPWIQGVDYKLLYAVNY